MTQEEKNLLINDLCGRLSYGVKCQIDIGDADVYVDTLATITIDGCVCFMETIDTEDVLEFGYIKPLLFPMSSMTEDEWNEYQTLKMTDWVKGDINGVFINAGTITDWLNAHHFDYRGLIEKGLANDATGLNIY